MGKSHTAELISIIKRRPPGKGAWRMDVAEVIDNFQEMVAAFRAISNKHPGDAETLGFVNKGLLAGTEALSKLNLLLLYKDEATNGNHVDARRGGDIDRDE